MGINEMRDITDNNKKRIFTVFGGKQKIMVESTKSSLYRTHNGEVPS